MKLSGYIPLDLLPRIYLMFGHNFFLNPFLLLKSRCLHKNRHHLDEKWRSYRHLKSLTGILGDFGFSAKNPILGFGFKCEFWVSNQMLIL